MNGELLSQAVTRTSLRGPPGRACSHIRLPTVAFGRGCTGWSRRKRGFPEEGWSGGYARTAELAETVEFSEAAKTARVRVEAQTCRIVRLLHVYTTNVSVCVLRGSSAGSCTSARATILRRDFLAAVRTLKSGTSAFAQSTAGGQFRASTNCALSA